MKNFLIRVSSWFHPLRSLRRRNKPFATWKKTIYTLFESAFGLVVYSYVLLVILSPLYFKKISSSDRFDFYALTDVSPQQVNKILEHSSDLIDQSPLNKPDTRYKIFLPSSDSLFSFFALNFIGDPSLAVNIFNVYLRPSAFSDMLNDGRIIDISGLIAHEATHTDQRAAVGLINILFTPKWIMEGYAEIIRGRSTVSEENTKNYICTGDRGEANSTQLYYAENRLLVRYLLDQESNNALSIHIDEFSRDLILTSLKELMCDRGKQGSEFQQNFHH